MMDERKAVIEGVGQAWAILDAMKKYGVPWRLKGDSFITGKFPRPEVRNVLSKWIIEHKAALLTFIREAELACPECGCQVQYRDTGISRCIKHHMEALDRIVNHERQAHDGACQDWARAAAPFANLLECPCGVRI